MNVYNCNEITSLSEVNRRIQLLKAATLYEMKILRRFATKPKLIQNFVQASPQWHCEKGSRKMVF